MLYLQCFIVLMFKIFWIILRSGLKISPPFFILLWGYSDGWLFSSINSFAKFELD